MNRIIKGEELFMFVFSICLFSFLHFAWWWYLVLILVPDISMIGYTFGNATGAICYNFFHHKAIAIGLYMSGLFLKNEAIQLAGLILFGHSSMDRMMGYGLKTFRGFKYTHLGEIGKNENRSNTSHSYSD